MGGKRENDKDIVCYLFIVYRDVISMRFAEGYKL